MVLCQTWIDRDAQKSQEIQGDNDCPQGPGWRRGRDSRGQGEVRK